MLIASTDIETTGLDPSWCQVLEVGVVLWDTTDFATPVKDLPAFHCYVIHPQIRDEAYALTMNARILERIAKREPGFTYLAPSLVADRLRAFVQEYAPHLVKKHEHGGSYAEVSPAGFNFDGFDRQFLNRLPRFGASVKISHRSLAPASLFFEPMTDAKLVGSDEVFRRAGVTVAPDDRHTALGDARGVIEVLRAGYNRPGGNDSLAPPEGPRCPDCRGRKTVRVPTGPYEADYDPCPTCQPKVDLFA